MVFKFVTSLFVY